jgi:hypothetical protein
MIGMACKKRIDANHSEDRLTVQTLHPGAEASFEIILVSGLLQQGSDPFAYADIAALSRTTNPIGEFDRDMYLKRFWPCHARTPCDEEPGTHCERLVSSKSESRTCQEHRDWRNSAICDAAQSKMIGYSGLSKSD